MPRANQPISGELINAVLAAKRCHDKRKPVAKRTVL
jgi:hypothetical protein